jgi:hypothetical protein
LWYIDPERNNESELKQVWVSAMRSIEHMSQTANIGIQFPGVHINCGGGSDDPFTKMEGDMESKHSPLRASFVTES